MTHSRRQGCLPAVQASAVQTFGEHLAYGPRKFLDADRAAALGFHGGHPHAGQAAGRDRPERRERLAAQRR